MQFFTPDYGQAIYDPLAQLAVLANIRLQGKYPNNWPQAAYPDAPDVRNRLMKAFSEAMSQQVRETQKDISTLQIMQYYLEVADSERYYDLDENVQHKIHQVVANAITNFIIENPENYSQRKGIVHDCREKIYEVERELNVDDLREYFRSYREGRPFLEKIKRAINRLSTEEVEQAVRTNLFNFSIDCRNSGLFHLRDIIESLGSDEAKEKFITLLFQEAKTMTGVSKIARAASGGDGAIYLYEGKKDEIKFATYFPLDVYFQRLIMLGPENKKGHKMHPYLFQKLSEYVEGLKDNHPMEYVIAHSSLGNYGGEINNRFILDIPESVKPTETTSQTEEEIFADLGEEIDALCSSKEAENATADWILQQRLDKLKVNPDIELERRVHQLKLPTALRHRELRDMSV